MSKSKYLYYRDNYVSVFNDDEKLLAVFVNDRGLTQVINYDDNFYSVEEDIIAYDKLIHHATSDEQEQREYLARFVKWIKKQIGDEELNSDYLEYRGIKL